MLCGDDLHSLLGLTGLPLHWDWTAAAHCVGRDPPFVRYANCAIRATVIGRVCHLRLCAGIIVFSRTFSLKVHYRVYADLVIFNYLAIAVGYLQQIYANVSALIGV
ncbi:MAG: hypothetical protein KME40_30800 [Komarekiella atlantica HA4396-MV6]|nr:hypothetical protein [Komarekiella atlantica HA4396-MV6]